MPIEDIIGTPIPFSIYYITYKLNMVDNRLLYKTIMLRKIKSSQIVLIHSGLVGLDR